MSRHPEAMRPVDWLTLVLFGWLLVPAFVVCRLGDAWAIVRGLALIGWELATTGKVRE